MKIRLIIPSLIAILGITAFLTILQLRHDYIRRDKISMTTLSQMETHLVQLMGTACHVEKLDKIEYGGQLSTDIYYVYLSCSAPHTELPKDSGGLGLGYYEERQSLVLRIPDNDYSAQQLDHAADLSAILALIKNCYAF